MEILIKLDKRLYKYAKHHTLTSVEIDEICGAIANGTPLPKGHGRLIDADELKRHKYHDNHRYENAVAVAYIDWADAIIEADKDKEDD